MTTHTHETMPLILVGTHLRDAHDYRLEPGENVFDVHDRLHAWEHDGGLWRRTTDAGDLMVQESGDGFTAYLELGGPEVVIGTAATPAGAMALADSKQKIDAYLASELVKAQRKLLG